VAFTFEAGYLSFYDVPWTFIQLDFTRVIWASGYVVLVLLPYLAALSFFAKLLSSSRHPLNRVLLVSLIPSLLIGALLVLSPLAFRQWWWIPLLLWGLLAIRFFLLPFIFREGGGNYLERITADLGGSSNPKLINRLSDSIENKILPTVLLLFIVALVTFLIGKNFARSEAVHWVLAESPDMLMVRNYGDTLLIKRLSQTTRELTDTLEIVKLSDSNNLNLVKNRGQVFEQHVPPPSPSVFHRKTGTLGKP
jgi:hypothetical protein